MDQNGHSTQVAIVSHHSMCFTVAGQGVCCLTQWCCDVIGWNFKTWEWGKRLFPLVAGDKDSH